MSRISRRRRRSEDVFSRPLTYFSPRPAFVGESWRPMSLRSPLVVRRFASEPRRIKRPMTAASRARFIPRTFVGHFNRYRGNLTVSRVGDLGVTQRAANKNLMRAYQYALLDRRTGQVVPRSGFLPLPEFMPVRKLKSLRGPHDLKVCLRRRARREVLFAIGGTSSRAPKRRTLSSTVEC